MAKILSGIDTKTVSVPAYSVTTLDYLDSRPNYFNVQNRGETMVYCGASSIPNAKQYDFSVGKGKSQMYADTANRSKFYIFNPSGSVVECVVKSFAADFDPLTMAFMGLELDTSGLSIESSNVISGFNASLPAGSNTIGKVGVSGALPAGSNKIGSVEVTGTVATLVNSILTALQNLAWTDSKITALMNAIDNIEGGSGGGGGEAVVSRPVTKFGGGSANTTLTAPDGYRISEIVFFSNDSENDMTVTHTDHAGTVSTVTIKAGEVLNNVKTWAQSFAISANGGAYRYGWSCEEV